MKKFLAMLLAVVMLLSVVACTKNDGNGDVTSDGDTTTAGGEGGVKYERGDDEEKYAAALADYQSLLLAAEKEQDVDLRFAMMAKAEAALLDSAVMLPCTTQGGAYTISRVAPRTIPYVQWGNDDDRLKGMVIADKFITPAHREELLAEWKKATLGEGTYDPAALLTAKGYSIKNTYALTFTTGPVTLDWLNTSSQSDTEITVNLVDGLVEYNNLGQMTPALAESWKISDDGLTYTFKLREGVKWYTADGAEYAEVTADDFVAGLQHMLDGNSGLEWLIQGVVKGVNEYLEGGKFSDVGYKATDKYTLTVTLEKPTSYFLTMLTYSCFLPICKSFYEAKGGVYGKTELAAATAGESYTYGLVSDVANQVYCGPFLLKKYVNESEILIEKNPNYYKAADVKLDSVKWVFFDGKDYNGFYNGVLEGVYAGCALSASTGILDKAKADGNFEKYAYISDTTSTTYFCGLNLNRGTFALESGAVASSKSEEAKISTDIAMQNKNFRKAICYAFDRATWNAVTKGEDLKTKNMRNMYTHPEFVSLSKEVTYDGKTFPAGTFYGEMVQYFCDQLNLGIKVQDGIDGWYNKDRAVAALAKAVEELGDTVKYPIELDVVYQSSDSAIAAQASACKQVIEGALGADKVQVNLVEATTKEDYYAGGYRAADGKSGNFDIFYGSGWGPDFGDPCSYLDTFLGDGVGYMTKVVGLF